MDASHSTVGPDDFADGNSAEAAHDWLDNLEFMAEFTASKDPREHTHDLPTREGSSRVYCIDEHTLGDVWCSLCDLSAVKEIHLTTGESVGRCSLHAWLLTAPAGGL